MIAVVLVLPDAPLVDHPDIDIVHVGDVLQIFELVDERPDTVRVVAGRRVDVLATERVQVVVERSARPDLIVVLDHYRSLVSSIWLLTEPNSHPATEPP